MTSAAQTLLTPAQVARCLGVSESSVRRLCDQGLLESVRTEGGHRRVRPAAVAAYARASSSVTLEQARAAAGQGGRLADEAELVRRTTQALVVGDAGLVRRILGELSLAGESAAYVADRLLKPAFVELGRRWCEGQLSVYQEHRASEIVLSCVAQARDAQRAPPRARRVLCAGPEGDPNSLASALCAWVLAELGYATVALGANMPFDSLGEAVRELKPQLLVLSISHVLDTRSCIVRCRELYALTSELECGLALGGRALTPALRAELSADFFGDTLTHLREHAERQKARARASSNSR